MSWRLWAVPVVSLSAWGCGPPEIVPVAPPGLAFERAESEPIPEDEAAQAIGENRAALTAAGEAAPPAAGPTPVGEARTTASGLAYETLEPGEGPQARPGQTVTVHYTGTLEDGSVFDSSRDRGEPFSFQLGAGAVIRGWDEGVAGMRVGERRKLTIPPELGYGAESPAPQIPPNSTLIFDVELLDVQ